MGWLSVISDIADVAESLFGKSKKGGETVSQEPMQTDIQKAAGSKAWDWAKEYMGDFVPGETYPGSFTAEKTPYETTGLNWLSQYLNAPATGDLFGAAKSQVMDTLSGKYADPESSPFIRSMKNIAQTELQDAINETRARRGARGSFFHSEGLTEERELTNRTLNNLNALIGQFIDTERGRMAEAVPQAQQLEQYESMAPLAKTEASQTYGALDRILEQNELEAQYNEWTRARAEKTMPLETTMGLYQTPVQFGIRDWQMPEREGTNTFGNIMNIIPKIQDIMDKIRR